MNKPETIGCVGNTIITASGGYFDYANPNAEQVCIWDIATALGNTCRFGGHSRFYSVAEHCYHCAKIALWFKSPSLELHALLHDASEAYVGDMPKPLKIMMPQFNEVEELVEGVIRESFELTDQWNAEVKRIDLIMLKAEKLFLFPNDDCNWHGFEKLPDVAVDFRCWNPVTAKHKFIALYDEIQEKHQPCP